MADFIWLQNGKQKKIPTELATLLKTKNRGNVVCLTSEPEEDGELLTMEQILLDERYVQRGLLIEKTLYAKIGGKNNRLEAKWEYELAIRAAKESETVRLFYEEIETGSEESFKATDVGDVDGKLEEWKAEFKADAYIIGRYSGELKEIQVLEAILQEMVLEIMKFQKPEEMQSFLEDMLQHGRQYQYLYEETQPIMIFLGPTYCYNILNVFAEQLGKALEEQGQCIEYYDVEKEDVNGLARLVNQSYKALIGFQTWIMSVERKEGNFFDLIQGPKYNFYVDHPIWLAEQLKSVPKDFSILTHDRNYKKFVEHYFKNVKKTCLLPPGGRTSAGDIWEKEREYGIVFLGTYGDYRKKLEVIRACVPKIRHLAAKYLFFMTKNTNLTAEEALKKALAYYDICLSEQDFLELFGEMKAVIQCVMYYYRERVVRTILEAGLELHVYGDSWKESPFWGNKKLVCHEAVEAEEALEVLQSAKISLNVMAWHKDGFTERIADSMLAGAVVVSDRSTQLEEEYNEECKLFSLEQLEYLPVIIRELLEWEEERTRIAKKAYQKASKCATWEKRAEQLLALIEEERKEIG
ncbi:MAG: glycosyltransferase [Roseburia sp.]